MGHSFRPIIAIIILLGISFLVIGLLTSRNGGGNANSISTIELPLEKTKEQIFSNPLLNVPVGTALIVDVSGTMDPYQSTIINQTPLIDYIITRLNTIWVPRIVVSRADNPSFNQRYRITRAYGLGSGIKMVNNFTTYRAIKNANPGGFLNYTAIDHGMRLVSELMSTPQDTSTVIMITDMAIDIGVSNNCPRGSAPYCAVEELRPLYDGDSHPGWWLVGFDVPYNQGRRPLFLSIWSYDIPQTRDMIDLIIQDLMAGMGDIITADNIHILELYPADYWKPVTDREWEPKGKIMYKDGSPLKWLKPESSFIVTSLYENAELDFSLNRFDQGRKTFEVPYEQTFEVKHGETLLKNISFRDTKMNEGTLDFRTIVPSGQFNGSFSRPDILDVIVIVSPRFSLAGLPWVTEWSQRISQFNHVVEGANSIAKVEKQTLTSRPIRLKFRKR